MESLPRNRGRNTSLVAALSVAGVEAALTVEGAIDRPVCEVFVRDLLVPALRPGQRVIWDNLSVRRGEMGRTLIEAVGCTLHVLPAYSPDLNPIEPGFSKLKTLLRQTGAHPRDGLDEAISAALPQLTPANASAWFTPWGDGTS